MTSVGGVHAASYTLALERLLTAACCLTGWFAHHSTDQSPCKRRISAPPREERGPAVPYFFVSKRRPAGTNSVDSPTAWNRAVDVLCVGEEPRTWLAESKRTKGTRPCADCGEGACGGFAVTRNAVEPSVSEPECSALPHRIHAAQVRDRRDIRRYPETEEPGDMDVAGLFRYLSVMRDQDLVVKFHTGPSVVPFSSCVMIFQ
jgi:hypothetical protein